MLNYFLYHGLFYTNIRNFGKTTKGLKNISIFENFFVYL